MNFNLFWTTKVYGFGKELRRYGYYPSFLPLCVYSSHGVTLSSEPAPHELNNLALVMLYFTPRPVNKYLQLSSKKCYSVVSPYVFYRRRKNIGQHDDKKGTLVFPAHSTPNIDDLSNMDIYISQLKTLPEKYAPLTICLHYHDMQKGLDKKFHDAGFEVVSVGNPNKRNFIKDFYEILRKYKYATSNSVGSYLFYATEMGIPFFLFGNAPQYFNKGDENVQKGVYDSYLKYDLTQKTILLFSEKRESVSQEQHFFVEKELGVHDSISRTKVSCLLYFSLLAIPLVLIKWCFSSISFNEK